MTLSGQPTMCQFEPAIAWNWGSGSPSPLISDDLFTGRWTGSSNFQAGTYRFNVIVDDGVRVYMDGKLIIDQWFNHAGTTITTNVSVTAGKHDLVVEYFEIGHDAQIYVWWEKIN